MIDYLIIAFIAVLAVATTLWFFKARREMLELTRDIVVELESAFKPRDKEYTLLGYLVGFRGTYKLSDGDEAYVLFTTFPRHSLLYYPIAKALGRKDRLEVAIRYRRRRVKREFHLVNARDGWAMSVSRGELKGKNLNKASLKDERGEFFVYGESPQDSELAAHLVRMTSYEIHKASAYKDAGLLEVALEGKRGAPKEALRLLEEMKRNLTRAIEAE